MNCPMCGNKLAAIVSDDQIVKLLCTNDGFGVTRKSPIFEILVRIHKADVIHARSVAELHKSRDEVIRVLEEELKRILEKKIC